MTTVQTLHVLISGRVQGVWYRAWTVEKANRLGLSGWVRNRTDGRVEAVFSGPPERVSEMLQKCRKGPLAARVDDIVTAPGAETVEPGFHKRPTV